MSDPSVQPVDDGGCCSKLGPWLGVMRFIGGILGLLIVILGVIGIVTIGSFDPRTFIDNCYQVLFGILIILAELRLARWLKFFTFLCSYAGLGVFYIFVGGLALGDQWYNYVLAALFVTLGIIYINIGCCQRGKMYPDKTKQAPVEPHSEIPLAPSKSFSQPASSQQQALPGGRSEQAHHFTAPQDTPETAWPEIEDKA